MGLTDKQRVFIEEYLIDFNATRAAERAGYRGNDATLAVVGYENRQKPYIATEIERRIQKRVRKRAELPKAAFREKKSSGYVYLIRAENGLVKIGKTINVERRFGTLSAMCPIDLELIGILFTEQAADLENELHKIFVDRRFKGEWFNLNQDGLLFLIDEYGFEQKA